MIRFLKGLDSTLTFLQFLVWSSDDSLSAFAFTQVVTDPFVWHHRQPPNRPPIHHRHFVRWISKERAFAGGGAEIVIFACFDFVQFHFYLCFERFQVFHKF